MSQLITWKHKLVMWLMSIVSWLVRDKNVGTTSTAPYYKFVSKNGCFEQIDPWGKDEPGIYTEKDGEPVR